jgi:hypothetical protein
MNVTLNIATTPVALPAGIVAGLLALSITDLAGQPVVDANGNPIVVQTVADTQATFANVVPGDYLANAVRLDTTGNPIGTKLTQAFTVPQPIVSTFDAPHAITVTLA